MAKKPINGARVSGALAFIRARGGRRHRAARRRASRPRSCRTRPPSWLYDALLDTPCRSASAPLVLDKSLLHWINDGLMAIFFFLVGLEIKRELVVGELSTREAGRAARHRRARRHGRAGADLHRASTGATPIALRGWAIPAATDIAFAVGVLALLGPRIPPALKMFLLALAIIDDLGAIIIIAVLLHGRSVARRAGAGRRRHRRARAAQPPRRHGASRPTCWSACSSGCAC